MELGACCRVSNFPKISGAYDLPLLPHLSGVSVPFSVTLPRRRNCNFKATLNVNSDSIQALEPVRGMSAEYSRELELSSLTSICPLDGRYWGKVKELAPFMSEYGLTIEYWWRSSGY